MSVLSGLSVSHTFHDFLPAIFLGAPEAESALDSLPGARMALEGRGLEAFRYTLAGGALSTVVFAIASPLLFLMLSPLYSSIISYMSYLLAFFLFFLVFRSRDFYPSATVAILSGALGMISFSMNVNQEFVLVPVFSGLFALPSLFHAASGGFELPSQSEIYPDKDGSIRGGILGFLAGLVAGVFPGLGAAVSTSFLTPLMSSRKEFLAAMGGVNTSDILVSFVALSLIGKARSGASVALKSISSVTPSRVFFLIGLSLMAAAVSIPLALSISSRFASVVKRVGLLKLVYPVAAVILVSTLYLTGIPGMLVLATSFFIGYSALLSGERASCMAVLIVPAISFYSTGIFI